MQPCPHNWQVIGALTKGLFDQIAPKESSPTEVEGMYSTKVLHAQLQPGICSTTHFFTNLVLARALHSRIAQNGSSAVEGAYTSKAKWDGA